MEYVLGFLGVLMISVSIVGKSYLDDTTLDTIPATSIWVTEPLNVSNITADSYSVTGSMNLANGIFQKVSVTGPVSLTDVAVTKDLRIIGMLNAVQSKFNKVTLTMFELILTNAFAALIIVNAPSNNEKQKLRVYGNQAKFSNVNGAKVIEY